MVPGRNARLLAPLEDELAEGEIAIEDEPGEDVVDFKHATSPDQPSAEKLRNTESTGTSLSDPGASDVFSAVAWVHHMRAPARNHCCP